MAAHAEFGFGHAEQVIATIPGRVRSVTASASVRCSGETTMGAVVSQGCCCQGRDQQQTDHYCD